jgi:SCY1-like protein 2
MSMGPLLNAAQFAKFMNVIKSLGTRVEREHSAQLGELRRLEESSGSGKGVGGGVEVDFESLVRGGGGMATMGGKEDLWSDDALVSLSSQEEGEED